MVLSEEDSKLCSTNKEEKNQAELKQEKGDIRDENEVQLDYESSYNTSLITPIAKQESQPQKTGMANQEAIKNCSDDNFKKKTLNDFIKKV